MLIILKKSNGNMLYLLKEKILNMKLILEKKNMNCNLDCKCFYAKYSYRVISELPLINVKVEV